MALYKLERINYGGKWLVSIKYQNLHSFKEGLILLFQSIHETRRITHLHGSAHFTIPLISLCSIPKGMYNKATRRVAILKSLCDHLIRLLLEETT